MKLKVDKYYVNRRGKKVKIVGVDDSFFHKVFFDENANAYTEDGYPDKKGMTQADRLVGEV